MLQLVANSFIMIKRLLYLAGLAIIGVVVFHAVGMGFVAMFDWADRYLPASVPAISQVGGFSYYFLRFFEQAANYSILTFLFVSGFFIAIATGRNQRTISWRIVGVRIKTLLIPYLFWSFVVIFLLILQGERFSIQKLVVALLVGRANPVYYFVPLLIQFYLLAPFLVPLARNHWKPLVAVTALLQLLVVLSYYPSVFTINVGPVLTLFQNIPQWFFLAFIFWFPLGMVIAFHTEQARKIFYRFRWWLLILTVLLLFIGMIEWELLYNASGLDWLSNRTTVVDELYALTFILAFLGFSDAKLPLTKQIDKIGSMAFGIYLTHALFIEYSARLINHFLPRLLAYQALLAVLLTCIGLLGPIVLMEFVSRTRLRRFYTYLFG